MFKIGVYIQTKATKLTLWKLSLPRSRPCIEASYVRTTPSAARCLPHEEDISTLSLTEKLDKPQHNCDSIY